MSTTPPKDPVTEPPADGPFAKTELVEPASETQPPPQATGTMDWPTFGIVIALILSLGLPAITPSSVFGVPLHTSINHFAVVFIPALAITTLIVIWKESWRRAWAFPLAIGGVVTTAVTNVTVESGKKLSAEYVPRTISDLRERFMGGPNEQHLVSQHAHAANWLQWIVFAFALVLVGHFVVGRLRKFDRDGLRRVFQVLATILASVAILAALYVGHLGERAASQHGDSAATVQQSRPFGNGNGRFGGSGSFGQRVRPGGPNANSTTPRQQFQRRSTTTAPGATAPTTTTAAPTA